MRTVIGLTGLPRSGKDTIADFLAEEHGFMKFSFAAPLYTEVSEAYDAPVELLQSDDWKHNPQRSLAIANCRNPEFCELLRKKGYMTFESMTSRRVLQFWGTEYRRHQNEDYWTSKMRKAIANATERIGADRFVIADCRVYHDAEGRVSYNEGLLVQRYGGTLYRVVRPGTSSNGHSSDIEFPSEMLSGSIANVGALQALYNEALHIMGMDQ